MSTWRRAIASLDQTIDPVQLGLQLIEGGFDVAVWLDGNQQRKKKYAPKTGGGLILAAVARDYALETLSGLSIARKFLS